MNAASLVARVQRRVPGYDPSEYLDEVNTAYKETWDYITQLDDSYFTDIKVVTVATQASEFDFHFNANGNLVSAASPRYFQVDRIRVQQPGDTNWIPCNPRDWNDPQVLAMAQDATQPPSMSPPYPYTLFANGSIKFPRPLPVGAQIELVYSFIWLGLQILSNGTVTASGTTVTGTGTNFTQIVFPDYQASLPGNDEDTDVGIELVIGPTQVYRVKAITSNTALTTFNTVVASGVNYQLASVPDIPHGHHNVISTLATRNFLSTPANDPRFAQWAALAEVEKNSMRDSIMARQRQEPPRRGRFPFPLARYTTYPTVTR